MNSIHQPVLIVATVATALVAGLFYSWSCGITQGLGKLSDGEYIRAMQSINREIQRPWFFLSFMGTVVLLPLATWFARNGGHHESFLWLLAASLCYLAGVFGVTVAGNVPLNEMLDKFITTAGSATTLSADRLSFEPKWNRLNNIRTFFAIVALVASVIACTRWHIIKT
ncbi:MAG: DUF1772 domain-containing protein [Sphingobacteriales bacterium]|nr:MAG: DUF1772 domain-containing protein [Sphingobacteriales bacterium]